MLSNLFSFISEMPCKGAHVARERFKTENTAAPKLFPETLGQTYTQIHVDMLGTLGSISSSFLSLGRKYKGDCSLDHTEGRQQGPLSLVELLEKSLHVLNLPTCSTPFF